MPKPYLHKLQQLGPIAVWVVDGLWVRHEGGENDFNNFGSWPKFASIPRDEFWLDTEASPDEYRFYLRNMVSARLALKRGASPDEAEEIGDRAEALLRQEVEPSRPADAVAQVQIRCLGQLRSSGVAVWLVDGALVRSWYRTSFTQGGHDLVYNWIPQGQIWIDNDVEPAELKLVISHEAYERSLMRRGMNYDSAHQRALGLEDRAYRWVTQRRSDYIPSWVYVLNEAKVRLADLYRAMTPTHTQALRGLCSSHPWLASLRWLPLDKIYAAVQEVDSHTGEADQIVRPLRQKRDALIRKAIRVLEEKVTSWQTLPDPTKSSASSRLGSKRLAVNPSSVLPKLVDAFHLMEADPSRPGAVWHLSEQVNRGVLPLGPNLRHFTAAEGNYIGFATCRNKHGLIGYSDEAWIFREGSGRPKKGDLEDALTFLTAAIECAVAGAVSDPAEAYLDEIYHIGEPTAEPSEIILYDQILLNLEQLSASEVYLNYIYVPPEARGSGAASKVLGLVADLADKHCVTLALKARSFRITDPYSRELDKTPGENLVSTEALVRLYTRFGFRGEARYMERTPQCSLQKAASGPRRRIRSCHIIHN